MPDRRKTVMIVVVDLDPIPGAMHSPESARSIVENALKNVIPHYNPKVHAIPTD